MISDPVMKKSIYASVIASVLVIVFIQPILNLSGRILIWLGANVNEGISRAIYLDAALGLSEKFSFIILTFILSGMLGLCTGVGTSAFLSENLCKKIKTFQSIVKSDLIGKIFKCL